MRKVVSGLALALVLAEVVLVLLSWFLSATAGGEGARSLLSSEGVRFFFGGFVGMVQQPLLVWLLLLAMAAGALRGSGVARSLRRPVGYRQRQALILAAVVLMAYVGVVLLLTATPHAVLLSATGQLWPSPFSRALVPLVAFAVLLLSVVYGLVTRHFVSTADICRALSDGIASAAPLLLLYVLAAQLCASLRFVFFS